MHSDHSRTMARTVQGYFCPKSIYLLTLVSWYVYALSLSLPPSCLPPPLSVPHPDLLLLNLYTPPLPPLPLMPPPNPYFWFPSLPSLAHAHVPHITPSVMNETAKAISVRLNPPKIRYYPIPSPMVSKKISRSYLILLN